ncbi:MAG: 16S rRNA (adenine(1518)-N(6)/adenine(1519)-N(6))-dimethyltransferase RsmA [Myxococcota bacterium]|nr:16S rRNA (adenine(1518)-N(6)/adenine(1519)-N(6))-dimethyltransferase RsmA [Myxococcota bacterium]
MSGSTLRSLLDKHNLRLRRELGQNFIVEEQVADRVATLAGVEPSDCVIEVGTGLGTLTHAIAKRAKFVLTIEIDSGLVRTLGEESLLDDNVELIHADVGKLDLAEIIARLAKEHGGNVRFVANLPFSSATPLLRRLLDLRHLLVDWSVILQSEVAERLFAPVNTRDYGSLAVLHQLCAEPGQRAVLGAQTFFPAPRVDSTLVSMRANDSAGLAPGELKKVERVARAAFGKRRKTLLNALRGGGLGLESDVILSTLESVGIDPRARAETVLPGAFLELTRALEKGGNHGAG